MSRINLLILTISFVIYYFNILINIKACINFFILDVDIDDETATCSNFFIRNFDPNLMFASKKLVAVISAGGRVRRTNAFFPPPGKGHLCLSCSRARLLLYFLRGVPLNTPRRTRLRIQVRRSTYVRLGFRSFAPTSPLPASSSASQNVTGARAFRHFRYMQNRPRKCPRCTL